MSVRYLTAAELYTINETVLGERPQIRDRKLLQSAIRRPALMMFGEAQFPTLLDKAAALLESLAYHHLFMDGNKRTALWAVVQFLRENGYAPTWQVADAQAFILDVAKGNHTLESMADWLREHTTVVG